MADGAIDTRNVCRYSCHPNERRHIESCGSGERILIA